MSVLMLVMLLVLMANNFVIDLAIVGMVVVGVVLCNFDLGLLSEERDDEGVRLSQEAWSIEGGVACLLTLPVLREEAPSEEMGGVSVGVSF